MCKGKEERERKNELKAHGFVQETKVAIEERKCNKLNIGVESMQRSGTEAIRAQLQPSKPKREITNITNSQKRTYGQPSEHLFPKGGHSATETTLKIIRTHVR